MIMKILLVIEVDENIFPKEWGQQHSRAWKFEVMRLKSEKKAVPTQWKRNKVNFHEKWQTQRKRQIR